MESPIKQSVQKAVSNRDFRPTPSFQRYLKTMTVTVVATLLLTACNWGRPNINGWDSGQPIMDGWLFEQAGEHWLPSVLKEENPQSPEEVANLTKVNVQVKLPVHEGNPMPHDGVTYRQASTGGFITFHLTSVEGDTLQPIGTADMQLKEKNYFEHPDTAHVRLKSWGKGIFTSYHIKKQMRKKGDGEQPVEWVEWDAAIISVYPGGDSLLICRGNAVQDAYVAE